jgi:geranylgeranyl diphosphate synthase type II
VSGLDERLEAYRRAVDAALEASLPPESAWPASLHRAARYSLFAGGKRLRPLLALASAEAVGGTTAEAMPLACAVEMVHTFSLIHDDLPAMDDDDLRRGQPTCHKVFGEAIAILAGDALLNRAFEVLLAVPETAGAELLRRRLDAAAGLASAIGSAGLVGGQVADLESEGVAVDAATLERIHRAKTGALLGACVRGGARLAGASAAERAALDTYAAAIGLAFQVVDDILDATEDAARLGKTAGKDQAARKATYVSVHGLEEARRTARSLLAEAHGSLEPLGQRGVTLAEIARRVVERRS